MSARQSVTSVHHVISLNKKGSHSKVTHCAKSVSAITRPHQLHWDDWEVGTGGGGGGGDCYLGKKFNQVASVVRLGVGR